MEVRIARSAGRVRWFWGGDILIGNDGDDKESCKVGRGLIVEEKVGERVREGFKKGYN